MSENSQHQVSDRSSTYFMPFGNHATDAVVFHCLLLLCVLVSVRLVESWDYLTAYGP